MSVLEWSILSIGFFQLGQAADNPVGTACAQLVGCFLLAGGTLEAVGWL